MSGTLEVQGEGRANATPDRIRLSFAVSSRAMGYWDTIQQLNQKTDELRGLIESAGVERSAVKTINFGISHRWKTVQKLDRTKKQRTEEQVFDGYTASHSLQIEIPHDKERVNKVLSRLAAGEHQASLSVDFFVGDPETLRKRAMAEAARIARENAEILAREAGVKLAGVQRVNYGWSEVRFRPMESMGYDRVCASMAAPDFEPDEVGDTQRVTMVYAIE